MKPIKVLLITAAMVMVTCAYSQRPFRGDVCQNIPDLTTEQKQKIDELSLKHQKTMDGLRTKFYSETDAVKASEIKSQMNSETADHYRNISGLLTPEQQTWFDQRCFAYSRRGNGQGMGYGRVGRGRGMGPGRGMGYGCRMGPGRGLGQGNRMGYGRGMGRISY